MEHKVTISINNLKTINLSMQQNYVPMIRSIVIVNNTEEELTNLSLNLKVTPEFGYEYNYYIANILPLQSIEITPIPILMNPEYLYSLTERYVGLIHTSLTQQGELIYKEESSIAILAYDEWSGLHEDRIYYWMESQKPMEYQCYRIESGVGTKRSMDEVPSEEILVAIQEVVLEQVSLSEEDLVRETAKKFGYSRLGTVIDSSIRYAIKKGLDENLLKRLDNGNIGI